MKLRRGQFNLNLLLYGLNFQFSCCFENDYFQVSKTLKIILYVARQTTSKYLEYRYKAYLMKDNLKKKGTGS